MLCIRCGAENQPSTKYCQGCQALLPQQAPTGDPPKGIEISEDRQYVVPEERFLTRNLNVLHDLLAEFLDTGEGKDLVQQHLETIKAAYRRFTEQAVPQLHDLLMHEDQDSDFPGQVRYLVARGTDLFGQGLADLETATDEAMLEAAFERLQQGNDNLCQSFVMLDQRKKQLERVNTSVTRSENS